MESYTIEVYGTIIQEYTVAAESPEEAVEKACDKFRKENYYDCIILEDWEILEEEEINDND